MSALWYLKHVRWNSNNVETKKCQTINFSIAYTCVALETNKQREEAFLNLNEQFSIRFSFLYLN